jgi:hypothetical protein
MYSDQDDLDAVLIKLAVLNFRKLSIPCSAGIKTLWFAMPSYLTSQAGIELWEKPLVYSGLDSPRAHRTRKSHFLLYGLASAWN